MKKLIVIAFTAALALACNQHTSVSKDGGLVLTDPLPEKFADVNTKPCSIVETDCVEHTISIQIDENSDLYNREIGFAPSTPTPIDVYVCGTVEGVDLYPGSDCVIRNAQRVGNTINVTYILRIGYIYTIAVYYDGWMRVDNIQVTSGASSITINGFIWRGNENTPASYGGTITYPNGIGSWGYAYGCFRVDRQSGGTIMVSQFNTAPCNRVIGTAVFSTGDSVLSITSATQVRWQTSLAHDVTGVTGGANSQPIMTGVWNAGLTRHTLTIPTFPLGIEHSIRSTTPQTNPVTGVDFNPDIMELETFTPHGGALVAMDDIYHHIINVNMITPPFYYYYAAEQAQLAGLTQNPDNRTTTVQVH